MDNIYILLFKISSLEQKKHPLRVHKHPGNPRGHSHSFTHTMRPSKHGTQLTDNHKGKEGSGKEARRLSP